METGATLVPLWQLFIHLMLTTPCPDPGPACHHAGKQRSPSGFRRGPPHNVSLAVSSVLAAVDMNLFPACILQFLSGLLAPLCSPGALPACPPAHLPLSSFLATPVSVFPSQPGFSRPVYTRCFPSSPPISPPTHCFLTRSSPSNGSRSGSTSCPSPQKSSWHCPPAMLAEEKKTEDPRTSSARTPGSSARGPQEAQREDPTHNAQREDLTHNTLQPFWIRPKPSSGILRGTLDTRTQTPAPGTLQL
ncbi:uncharacterized protein LOC110324815 isoform X5 [Mus pahari]|uniref:uncharacterized protein LOC110324815 isoform X5 n=1 Tax=Mus pahari TaxID=10093 RepID=UPI00111471F9|nr:uncharacterized protein LOC110324815 isoform X5 [Mus pahari]XP_029396463.1 uncharacterized protein LOC110324815 isoform X5 [Mus pahari]